MTFKKYHLFFLLLVPCLSFAQKDSLRHKIGQMLLIGLPTSELDTNSVFYKEVKTGNLGGITMYERHLKPENSAAQLRLLISAYQAAAPVPLFVAITQEGGVVNRLKTKYGFPEMPSAQYLGSINNRDSTKWYADNAAFSLSRLGINVNFAPVLDVFFAQNPVLGSRERTFGADTSLIVQHASMVIKAHDYFNVLTAVKHFPGHGSSVTDTHLQLTDVTNTWMPLELAPYKTLIKMGLAHAVMTAHIVNKRLDETGLPATLSKKMIDGLLRKQMGFNGLVFSDDMHMKAISAEYPIREAVALAINAGVDVLLFSGNSDGIKSAAELVDMIVQLVSEKKVSEKNINESYQRIILYKKQYCRLPS